MAKMTPSGMKKHCKSTKPESHLASGQNALLSFFFFSSSDRLVQSSWLFLGSFCTNSSILHWVSRTAWIVTPFSSFVHMYTKHFAMILLRARLLNYKYGKCDRECQSGDRECQSGSYLNRCLGQWHLLTKPVKSDLFAVLWYIANFSSGMHLQLTRK